MLNWRTTALLPSLLGLVLGAPVAGCLAHERGEDLDAGGLAGDSSFVARDASSMPDTRPFEAPDATPRHDAGACAPSDLTVDVRIEPITSDVARCAVTHSEGASLTGIDMAPADDGIRLHFDLCPAADADCRCDIVVANVGTDIAGTLSPATNLTIDVAAGTHSIPFGAFLAITKTPTCMCDGCGCSEPLYLYAATGSPDFARSVPAPMTFARGAQVCAGTGGEFGATWMLHAVGDGGAADVPGGAQRDVGSVHVRSISDIYIFGPGAACAGCDTPVGAWIAWVSS